MNIIMKTIINTLVESKNKKMFDKNLEELRNFDKKIESGAVEKIKEFSVSSDGWPFSGPLARLYMKTQGLLAGANYAHIWNSGYGHVMLLGKDNQSYSGAFYRDKK